MNVSTKYDFWHMCQLLFTRGRYKAEYFM